MDDVGHALTDWFMFVFHLVNEGCHQSVNRTSHLLRPPCSSVFQTVQNVLDCDLLQTKQHLWKLFPSHCTSSAWYTVPLHAVHVLPPPQFGIWKKCDL